MVEMNNLIMIRNFLTEIGTLNPKEISFSVFEHENNEEVESIINDIFVKAVNNKSSKIRKEMLKILKKEYKEEFKELKNLKKSKYYRNTWNLNPNNEKI